jgi:RNA polymerase sigma factor, sigma-70 family
MDGNDILKNLNKGDILAFECLVDLYERRIYGFIYNITHDYSLTEDLTQDVFLKVYQNIYRYNPDYPIKPWIFKIAYNITVNYLKKNKIKEVELDDRIQKCCSVEDDVNRLEIKQAVLQGIQHLKPNCRAIFALRIVEDLPFEQIAQMLQTSTASVKLKFYRNRKFLIKSLTKSFSEVDL